MGCTCSIASPATGELTEANLHRLHRYYVSTNLQPQTSSPLSALSEDDSDGAACYRSQRCKAEPVTPPLTPAASKVSSNRSRGAPPSYVSMTEDWVASVEQPSAVPGVDELDWSPHMTTVASYEADVTGPTQLDDC